MARVKEKSTPSFYTITITHTIRRDECTMHEMSTNKNVFHKNVDLVGSQRRITLPQTFEYFFNAYFWLFYGFARKFH